MWDICFIGNASPHKLAWLEPVARKLWGEPNKALSHKLELRWGSGGSKKMELTGDHFWHNFETGQGGGVLKLVMAEIGGD